MLVPASVALSDSEVDANVDMKLIAKDNINLQNSYAETPVDEIEDAAFEKENDIASIVAALKTMEVLGQIGGRYYIAQVLTLMTAFDQVGVTA